MANTLYDLGRQKFLEGSIAWLTDDIRLVLVNVSGAGTLYTFSQTHEFLSDIPAGARVATSGNFTGKTSTAGVADADDVTLLAVTGDQSEALVIYKWTGSDATSPLIAYIDSATGLPVQPSGSSIEISWDNGSNKIMKI